MATTYLSIFFNSRSPHGERLNQYVLVKLHLIFQFTLPTWRATKQTRNIDYSDIFSIHAPRMESDRGANRRCICIHLFNSRSPHGERQRNQLRFFGELHIFNSRSPHGERLRAKPFFIYSVIFNSRSPHGERWWQDFLMILSCFFCSFPRTKKKPVFCLAFSAFSFVLLMVRAGAAYTFLSMVTPFGRFSVSIVTS